MTNIKIYLLVRKVLNFALTFIIHKLQLKWVTIYGCDPIELRREPNLVRVIVGNILQIKLHC